MCLKHTNEKGKLMLMETPINTIGQFNPASAPDYLPVAQLRQWQFSRLSAMVKWAYENVQMVRARMAQRQMTPDDLQSLEDITKLPFTVKNDLRDTYPFGLFACGFPEVVRLHASSGTTGKPIVVAYTQQDVDVWIHRRPGLPLRRRSIGGGGYSHVRRQH